jgi:hypothetical protein
MNFILYNKKKDIIQIIKRDEVLENLYYNKFSIPNKKQLELYLKKNTLEEVKKYKSLDDYIIFLKDSISKIDNKIPLYDKYNENLYLIDNDKVYTRVIYNHFRYPTENILNLLKKKIRSEKDQILSNRNEKKYNLINKFLDNFNKKILYETYVNVFYNSSNKELTSCYKPSFMYYSYMKPFYSRSEIINLSLNMGLVKPNKIIYEKENLKKLCFKISKNDIPSSILKSHLNHIIDNDCIGVVQFYSLQGSFFINEYLRENVNYNERNISLEKIIKSMWNLILNSPPFDKNYVLYRFIKEDDHLKNLKINNLYIPSSFLSTTRDPFYNSKEFKFGFILIRINIPKDVKGVGLCIETLSQFQEEQEILLPPLCKLKLKKKDNNIEYYHNNENFKSKVKTKYEFDFVNNSKISFPEIYKDDNEDKTPINFLDIPSQDFSSIEEKIKYFVSNFLDDKFQFDVSIGTETYNIFVEYYDSTSIYKKFYSMKSNNGFSMYSFKDNNMLFFIEIGNIDGRICMYVDYYFRYSTKGIKNEIEEKDYLIFLSSIALYFKVNDLIIFCQYNFCNLNKTKKYILRGGYYNLDIYKYIKFKKKKYNYNSINPKFSYFLLDELSNTSAMEVLNREDNDELYQIYQEYLKTNKNNLSDFYIWITENYCFMLNKFIEKIDRLFNSIKNPFREKNEYYIIDYGEFLYENKEIDYIPRVNKDKKKKDTFYISKNKNMYRINSSLRIR